MLDNHGAHDHQITQAQYLRIEYHSSPQSEILQYLSHNQYSPRLIHRAYLRQNLLYPNEFLRRNVSFLINFKIFKIQLKPQNKKRPKLWRRFMLFDSK